MVAPVAASLSCPSCGAAIAPRAFGWAVTIACSSCAAVLDASDPNLAILQRQEQRMTVKPLIPLGTRGTWFGVPWEVIGFQVVTITVDDTDYSWSEYVAFNPYRGFIYLSEYEGHWNVIEKLHQRPNDNLRAGGRPAAAFGGLTYKHFQSALARTTFALGEFPWALRVGYQVISRDYVSPPSMLSAEGSDYEVTWSKGTYTPSASIAKAFGLGKKLPAPVGVFANQPNPYAGTAGKVFRWFGVFMLAFFVILFGNMALSHGTDVYRNNFTFVHGNDDQAAFVTPAFELTGRPSNVALNINTQLDNDWMYFTFTLINETTGEIREAGKQVSFYSGVDSDGKWTEGSRNGSVYYASVPAGKYFLRVAPEGGEPAKQSAAYSLHVRRDVPHYGFYIIAFIALALPALFCWVPGATFESRRWAESDYAPTSGDDGDDDE